MTVLVVGDTWFGHGGNDEICVDETYWENLFGEPCDEIILIANFEGTLGRGRARPNRSVILDADETLLKVLIPFKVIIFSLANNHVTDRGLDGLIETKQRLEKLGFLTIGSGKTIKEARRPISLNLKGSTIAILSYCDTRKFVGGIPATATTPGVAPIDPLLIIQDIRRAKNEFEKVWLLLHWGYEYYRYPVPEMRHWARQWAEAGASLIIGTHPHNLGGVEQIGETHIFYSLGNFIFPAPMTQQGFPLYFDYISRQSMAISINENNFKFHIQYYLLGHDGWPRRVSTPEDIQLKKNLSYLSAPLGQDYWKLYQRISFKDRIIKNIRRVKCMTWGERIHRISRFGKL